MKLWWTALSAIAAPTVVAVSRTDTDSFRVDVMRNERILRRLTQVQFVGNNHFPRAAFPLGLCEGDCDRDSDCQGNLRCFQRGASRESVPGCTGADADATRFDYCYDPLTPTPASAPPSGITTMPTATITAAPTGVTTSMTTSMPSSSNTTAAPVATAPPITIDAFRLKLYWEDGYYWQEETFERPWCVRCTSLGCQVDGAMIIVNCDNDGNHGEPDLFRFLQLPSTDGTATFQIQEITSELCFQRTQDRQISLQPCQAELLRQQFFSSGGNVAIGDRFQMQPLDYPGFCVTQDHHPKYGEFLELQSCPYAEYSETSYWVLLP
jgi:hypothetical protein